MDAHNEMLLWYLAYRDTLAMRAGDAPPFGRTIDQRLPLRRRLARWCGYAALRVGTWPLAEDGWTTARGADGSQRPVASRS